MPGCKLIGVPGRGTFPIDRLISHFSFTAFLFDCAVADTEAMLQANKKINRRSILIRGGFLKITLLISLITEHTAKQKEQPVTTNQSGLKTHHVRA